MRHFSLTVQGEIAQVTFDMQEEKVNKFNQVVFEELVSIIESLEQRLGLEWVIFDSAKKGIFIAGADIKELESVSTPEAGRALIERGQQVFDRWSKLKPKTVALVDGAALGGGLEFCLAFDHIVVTDSKKVKMGLPEVNLGIIPGWGGTQRMPRRIGLIAAVQCIATGKIINAKKALSLRLADAMVASEFKQDALINLIRKKALKRRKPKTSILEWMLFRRFVFRKAKQQILEKTKGHYPAPLNALDVIQKTFGGSLKKGLKIEADGVARLFNTQIPKYLMGLFFSQENAKKNTPKFAGNPIQNVGVCGAGLMGGGIAWWFVNGGLFVRFKDVTWKMIHIGLSSIQALIQKGVKRKKVPAFQLPLMMDRVSSTLDNHGFQSMDFVIEAVPEDIKIKKKVLKEMEAAVSKNTILATNTSSLSVLEISESLSQPHRFLGVHFFSPVHKMPLVEIIPTPHTSPEVVGKVCQMVLKNKKTPIIVKDCPGFLINRVLLPYVNEAVHLMVQGYRVDDIDRLAVNFGMPIGPLALADEVGLDIGKHVLDSLFKGYGSRMKMPEQLKKMVLDPQMLGKKTGKGFYKHAKESTSMNSDLYKQFSIVMKRRISDQDEIEIMDRLILVMVNEASRCLDEQVVKDADTLDLAMIMGIGFPPFRGGLCRYADARGAGEIVHRLNQLAQSVGPRFKPSEYILNLSQENRLFYRS